MVSKFFEWVGEEIELHGMKKCIVVAIGIIGVILIFSILWRQEKDVEIKPFRSAMVVLEEDIIIPVTRKAKASDGFSMSSMITDMFSGIDSETDAVMAFNQLLEVCDDASEKKEVLKIPKGAGYSEMSGVGIYMWGRTGKHMLTEAEFSEIHGILLYGGNYIKVSWVVKVHNIEMSVEIDTGIY